ncbi:putative Endonuclease Exonuclease phosphatase family [Trypanosoma vivax]|uniref:DNA-(apurinic or apyrimidinic site) endonuclease n=1 Tax=Trypanosoma vivax (strain Y486) TaxID=1055687 RepID=G0U1E2_TRYVY|nr:putative apurinic/apyrimidinic endonuclease [Trypanosoma vivax]KAH8608907.1 putative Endonuclease Exonuclease phosphatase family [Trypanosoma vivax]CCC49897.1 putative apurinic/apyrimidinic endonuclease [Trypanosoma vivax Y486]
MMPAKNTSGTQNIVGAVKRIRSESPTASPPANGGATLERSKAPSPPRSAELAAHSSSHSSTVPVPAARPRRAAERVNKTEESIWSQVVPFKRRTKDEDFRADDMFKFITWNVAGLRGLLKKDSSAIQKLLEEQKPDALCLQETKLNMDDPINETLGVVPGYQFVDHPCRSKKGYSGTRTYVKREVADEWRAVFVPGFGSLQSPLIGDGNDADDEGRVLTTYLGTDKGGGENFSLALVNTYVPNSGMGLERLPYRYQAFDVKMREHLRNMGKKCRPFMPAGGSSVVDNNGGNDEKPESQTTLPPLAGVIWAGDLNVAERDYDRYYAGNYISMQKCSGFTPEERSSFRETLRAVNAVDAFRELYPRAAPVYTFWSSRIGARMRDLGWRLDYFVVSAALTRRVIDCFTMPNVLGSDHCPVQLWLRKK